MDVEQREPQKPGDEGRHPGRRHGTREDVVHSGVGPHELSRRKTHGKVSPRVSSLGRNDPNFVHFLQRPEAFFTRQLPRSALRYMPDPELLLQQSSLPSAKSWQKYGFTVAGKQPIKKQKVKLFIFERL